MSELKSDRHGFERIGILYALALGCIAAAIIASQVYIQQYIKKQEYDARVINLSGRQRMLSQNISKLALQISIAHDAEKRKILAEKLEGSLIRWTSSHQGLLEGNEVLGVNGKNSLVVDSMYQAIAPYYHVMVRNAEQLLQSLKKDPDASSVKLSAYTEAILANEDRFLQGMDDIVFQYDEEARGRVVYLEKIEIILLGISLGIILFVLLFIFRPTARKIKKTVSELMKSEKMAHEMAHEIGVLYGSLEKSYQELADVKIKEEEPVLYAKMDGQGNFQLTSDPFRDVLEYDVMQEHHNLFSWLEHEKYQHDNIERIQRLVSDGKTWIGEAKVTSESGDFIWLNMHIIPILDEQQRVSQLTLVCADRTERKEAEVISQEINRGKIEKEVSEQRFRSILILEGQEEERKRISRDIHDGIGQLLTALRIKIETIDLAPDVPERKKKVGEAIKNLEHIIREVRRVSFNLTPSILNDYGIVAVTKRFCAEAGKLSDKKIIFENKTGFINRLNQRTEINLYRIVQEAVNNAIKYAQADEIKVIFSHNAHYLNVEVIDNGVGFDAEFHLQHESLQGRGLGIFNMRERANFIEGDFEITSKAGEGTKINIHLPINGRKNDTYQSAFG